MVFLVEEESISNAMNDSDLLRATTASWAAGSSSSSSSSGLGNHTTDVTAAVKLEAVVEQLVSQATLDKVTFVFGMVLIPMFAIFGVVGNVLSLVVLVQHRMRSTTNVCLAALAVSDLLLLLHSLTFSALRIYGLRDPLGALRARRSTYPVLGAYGSIVCARITTWLTTMLGVERCIAVYLPIKAKAINSRRSTLLATAAIYLLTALAFLPTALQYKVVHVRTARNLTFPKLELSALGRNQRFMVPYGLALNILFRFIPLVILVVVNALITVAIRRTRALRRSMSGGSSAGGVGGGGGGRGGGQGIGYEQNRITMMLLTISGVFLVCTLPGAVNTIVSRITAHYSRLGAQGNLYQALALVTYFLETFNSSVNFVIYMAFSRKFCHTYQEIFCCRPSPWQPWPGSVRTVRFAPRGAYSSTPRSSHEMHCMQYRPLQTPTPLLYTPAAAAAAASTSSSGGTQRMRLLLNGSARSRSSSSFDVDDKQLVPLGKGHHPPARGLANGSVPIHGACCTCRQGNPSRSRSQSHSRSSRSRSQSQSHSSESAAQQYS